MQIRKQKIHRTCKALLNRYGFENPPVNVRGIALSEGVRIASALLPESLGGFIHRRVDDSTLLVVNERLEPYPERQRWVIAHELGHFFLHAGQYHVTTDKFFKKQDRDSFSGVNPEEVEANQFAAELLMPEDMVHDMILAQEKFETKALAEAFGVEESMLKFRLGALGYL